MATADEILGIAPKPPMAPADRVLAAVPGARVTSTWRSRAKQDALIAQGLTRATNSHHLDPTGAVDFVPPPGMTEAQALAALRAQDPNPTELLAEGTHVHYAPGGPHATADSILGLNADNVLGVNQPPAPPPSAAAQAQAKAQFSGWNSMGHGAAATPAPKPMRKPGPLADLRRNYDTARNAGAAALQEGVGSVMNGTAVSDPLETLKAAGNIAGGGFSYLMSPITGALATYPGPQIEQLTGGRIPADVFANDVVNIGAAAFGGAKPKIGETPRPSAIPEYAPEAGGTGAAIRRGRAAKAAVAPPQAPVTADAVLGVKPQRAIAADVETPDTLASDILVAPRKPRGAAPPPAPPAAPAGPLAAAQGALSGVNKAVRAVVAPATVDDDAVAAAGFIRGAGARHQLAADQDAYKLLQLDKRVGDLPMPRFLDFTRFIENRSKGAKLADPSLQPVADAIRDTYTGWRHRITDTLRPEQVPNFIGDYYSHLWNEQPSQVVDTMNAFFSRQGTGRNFKARSIPTIEDGIAAGLTPRTTNPIQNTLIYAQNMARYVTTHEVQNTMEDSGLAGRFAPGQQPPGWVPLQGILTRKAGKVIIDAEDRAPVAMQPEKQLYAPQSAARVYNNWISKGFEGGDLGPFVGGLRNLSNASVQLKLGLSGFHAVTMTNEAIASEAARGIQAGLRGDVLGAGKALGNAATLAGPAIKYAWRGNRMRDQLLKGKAATPAEQEINDLYINQGGRVHMDTLYRSSAGRSFYDSLKSGTLGRDVRSAVAGMTKGTPWERTKNVAGLASNAIQSAAAPIFEEYIPRLKQGAFAERMSDWLDQNPAATDAEKLAFAKHLGDSIDNRFGELVQDNLFWRKEGKQLAQIAMVSPTWNIGTLREIGGGLADIVPTAKNLLAGKGLNVSERTAYVAGLAATVALTSSVYQYLKTGQAPQDIRDLMAPRTGGTQRVGGKYGADVPERAAIPGYQKDVYGFLYDFPNHVLQEGINKLNPGPKAIVDLATNTDYQDRPIYPGKIGTAGQNAAAVGSYLADQALPISAGAFQRKKGSKISAAERILGLRESPGYVAAPQITTAQARKREQKAWDWKTSSDKAAARRMESSY